MPPPSRSQPTYEELKHDLAGDETGAAHGSQPTYEELKLVGRPPVLVLSTVPSLPMRN